MHIGAIEALPSNCWRWRCWGKCAHMLVEVCLVGGRQAGLRLVLLILRVAGVCACGA